MEQIIDGIYRIEDVIGEGSGGIVYLGTHLRLGKKIVLKADKNVADVDTKELRREADVLKSLNHSYIPQVYDYLSSGGTVYTVMEYIDGENLNLVMKREIRPQQKDVIRWAKELLEALQYLHTKKPHGILHGDIKPSNIMLRQDGTVCLIDFNISLMLDHNGAVRMGFSRGFAAPECYEEKAQTNALLQPLSTGSSPASTKESNDPAKTELLSPSSDKEVLNTDDIPTEIMEAIPYETASSNKTAKNKDLDQPEDEQAELTYGHVEVTSDLYSLGATLYYLLSGRIPAERPEDIIPLTERECSPALRHILEKSMQRDPKNRYQSAAEMLAALQTIKESDLRTVRLKKMQKVVAVAGGLLLLFGGIFTYAGVQKLQREQTIVTAIAKSRQAHENEDDNKAISYAVQAVTTSKAGEDAEALYALSDALGVYNMEEIVQDQGTISLAAEPQKVISSPKETKYGVFYGDHITIYNASNHQELSIISSDENDLVDLAFVGEDFVITADSSDTILFDLNSGDAVWSGEHATTVAVSGSETRIAVLDAKSGRYFIYRTDDGTLLQSGSLPVKNAESVTKEGATLSFSTDESCLLTLLPDKSLWMIELDRDGSAVSLTSDNVCSLSGFWNNYVYYVLEEDGKSSLYCYPLSEVWPGSTFASSKAPAALVTTSDQMEVIVGQNGIFFTEEDLLQQVDPITGEISTLIDLEGDLITHIAISDQFAVVMTANETLTVKTLNGRFRSNMKIDRDLNILSIVGDSLLIGYKNEPYFYVKKLTAREDQEVLNYFSDESHENAFIGKSNKTAILYDVNHFTIYDLTDYHVVNQQYFEDSLNIEDVLYRRDAEIPYLEVVYLNGERRFYNTETGAVLTNTPAGWEKWSYNEISAGSYTIRLTEDQESVVYQNGTRIDVLEREAFPVDAWDFQGMLITKYVKADGSRYGIVWSETFEILAYLPNLSDVTADAFIFDDRHGGLRQSPFYSREDLLQLTTQHEGIYD